METAPHPRHAGLQKNTCSQSGPSCSDGKHRKGILDRAVRQQERGTKKEPVTEVRSPKTHLWLLASLSLSRLSADVHILTPQLTVRSTGYENEPSNQPQTVLLVLKLFEL